MNEFEQQVFNSLSEEEQEKIAGGENIGPDDTLSKQQCDGLRDAAAAKHEVTQTIVNHLLQKPMLMYGLPMPKTPHWPTNPPGTLPRIGSAHPTAEHKHSYSARDNPRTS